MRACSSCSTPSATTVSLSERPSEIMVDTSVMALASSSIAVTKVRSIFSVCTGSRAR